tara:strand:+ start:357 stop:560 length:204 start_codon:yes stop_codon:yes gene_type:complete
MLWESYTINNLNNRRALMLNTSNIILELDNEHQELAARDQFNILLDILLDQENIKTTDIFFRSSNNG